MNTAMYLHEPRDFMSAYKLLRAGKKLKKDRLYYLTKNAIAYGQFVERLELKRQKKLDSFIVNVLKREPDMRN